MAEYKQKLLFRDISVYSEAYKESLQSIWAYSSTSNGNTINGRFKVEIVLDTVYDMMDDGYVDTRSVLDDANIGSVAKWTDNGWVSCFSLRKPSSENFRVFEKELVEKFKCFVSATSFDGEKTIKPSKPPKPGKIFDKNYDVYKISKNPKKMNKIFEIL